MALCMTSSGWAAAESATLENAVLRLEVQQSPNPYIARLVHKASGQAVVAEPSYKGLFAISLDKADGSQEMIESGRAGASTMNVAKTDTGNKLTLTYGKFPGLDLAVEVTATCDAKEPLTHWSIRVENRTGRRLRAVRFPQLLAVPTLGTGKDDVLVLPALPGTLIENPAENWRVGQSVTLQYPGNLSAQFLAYQDPTAGVYLAGTNRDGWPMSLVVFRQADGLRLWHEFTVASDGPSADNVWESPYPVALGVTQGAWYDSADLYKQWAVRQPWCAKPLAQRDDIPAWLKAGPDVHVVCVRTYDSQRTCTGSYYPKLLEHLRTFRDKLDGPVVAMLAGWENHRRWTGGDYFPIFDEPQARTVISQLAQDGFRPFFYLSGLFFTYWNEGRDGGEIPAAQKYSAAYVIDEKTGKPKEYVLNESNPSGDWKRHSYQFCVGSPETKEFFCRVVDQAQALGINVLQMDQTVSGAGDACASTSHRHAPGAGRYQSQAFWDLLDALRERGKRRSADFALLHEEPHEQLIPHLDGFHVREYYEKRWYRAQPGAIGIPLFSYLYHEYSLGYGGDSAGLSKQNSRWNVRTHAMNLVAGRTPGGAIWSSHASMSEAHPDQIAILRNHSRLLKTRAKDFLMLGRMLHPLKLDEPTLAIAAPLDKHSKGKGEVPTPAILTSSWQSSDGRIGHLFVNISETKQPLNVRLDTRNVPARGSYDVELYESKDRSSFQPLWQGVQLPKEFARELAPMEVVFLELREAR
jgi:hypothetical protein